MRACVLGLFLTAAALLPKTGNAQAFSFRTPQPDVSAAAAEWQINSDPIVVSGLLYYPTRAFRIFDGQLMVQVGMVDRVPVYADTTLEPYSLVYVPIGGARMREYERRRDGELASTTGSRVPSFPVALATERVPAEPPAGTNGARDIAGTTGIRTDAAFAATSRGIESVGPSAVGTAGVPERRRTRRTVLE